MNIPDEAVEAAYKAVLAYKSTRGIDNQANAMRAALEAAAPYLMAQAYDEALDEVAGSYMFRSDVEELKEDNPHRKEQP